jgi:hypothetical protein
MEVGDSLLALGTPPGKKKTFELRHAFRLQRTAFSVNPFFYFFASSSLFFSFFRH